MPLAHRDFSSVLTKHGFAELKKIGEGSFGKALLVQTEDGTKLVCKAVDVSSASSKETQDAVKESRLLAALKHPYIVRYRHSFIESGWLCIFMDYCEGGDLSKVIESAKRRGQRLPEEQILRWITQALLALKYIHEKHVLHRDLKSGNFFISSSGNLKMGDFGIAKVLSSTMACARTQLFPRYYLSPEVCQEKPYTWPSDIWAMGCILYELCALKAAAFRQVPRGLESVEAALCCQVPFDAPNISALVQRICRGPTPTLPTSSEFLRQLCGATCLIGQQWTTRGNFKSCLVWSIWEVPSLGGGRGVAAREGFCFLPWFWGFRLSDSAVLRQIVGCVYGLDGSFSSCFDR
ncbi:Nek1 [Symbiodinium natans]|uniref:non-specific serine/threonine protein kinase n=1 Tax=Symbiodinium natans TaxID=878477 RepID=A0A812RFM7_9DINO|nr:Nek1 [Symbiodinium natans]